ncbi:MAG: hypothetical protein WKG07_29685 [Hymenobacter sp.]
MRVTGTLPGQQPHAARPHRTRHPPQPQAGGAVLAGSGGDATGYVSGQLAVTGAPRAPVVRGTLTTSDEAGLCGAAAGRPYRLPGQAWCLTRAG